MFNIECALIYFSAIFLLFLFIPMLKKEILRLNVHSARSDTFFCTLPNVYEINRIHLHMNNNEQLRLHLEIIELIAYFTCTDAFLFCRAFEVYWLR